MGPESLAKSGDSDMAKEVMIPLDGIVDDGFWDDNPPLILGAVTNQMCAIKFLAIVSVVVEQKQACGVALLSSGELLEVQRKDFNVLRIIKKAIR